jgi:glycosyltransferase involved in cell wall biosynthesis
VIREPGGTLFLDNKFVSGTEFIREAWGGPLHCILRESSGRFAFGSSVDPETLGFGISVVPAGAPVDPAVADAHDVVLLAADSHLDLDFATLARGRRAKTVYAIEYTLGTRLRIAMLDRERNLARRLWSCGWNVRQEFRRRRALREADGVQVNGYPALEAYRGINRDVFLYLDNRMTADLFATGDEMDARREHLVSGKPLRLVNSGRLDPMKGAQDLVPVALALAQLGVNFTLDIFGDGSLAPQIARDVAESGLSDRVRMHPPVDFATELVPFSRTSADIFLSCHRQADPSCTYVEAMGCGLPVVGYANGMLSAVVAQSRGGFTVPLGDTGALARRIAGFAAAPETVVEAGETALAFSRAHDFASQFEGRVAQLRRLAGLAAG